MLGTGSIQCDIYILGSLLEPALWKLCVIFHGFILKSAKAKLLHDKRFRDKLDDQFKSE